MCVSFVAGLGFQSKVGAALDQPQSRRLAGLSRLLPLEHNLLDLPAADRREPQREQLFLSHPCPDARDSQAKSVGLYSTRVAASAASCSRPTGKGLKCHSLFPFVTCGVALQWDFFPLSISS